MAKSTLLFSLLLITLLSSSNHSRATIADDEKDCADQLQNLAACIPYVSGTAAKPSPECCSDAEKVRSSMPKCLCVLIMECCSDAEKVRSSMPKCLCVLIIESTDTSLALPINTTLALQMPAACNSDAQISDCPKILKLSPDSPNAKIFKDRNGDSLTATPPSADSAPSSAQGSSNSKVAPNNNNNSAGRSLESFMSKGVVVVMVSVAVIIFL